MAEPEADQAAARDRDVLVPRVVAYWRALVSEGVPPALTSSLLQQYQTTLLVLLEQRDNPGLDDFDLDGWEDGDPTSRPPH